MVKTCEDKLASLLETLEESTHCPICFEEYTVKNPAFLLTTSNNVYHQQCIETNLAYQERHRLPKTEPFTRKKVKANDSIQPIGSYQNLVCETFAVLSTTQTLLKMKDTLIKQLAKADETPKELITDNGTIVDTSPSNQENNPQPAKIELKPL
jgi:hypothetical protein